MYIGGTHVHILCTCTCTMSCSERFAPLCLCSHARLPRQSPLGCRQPARLVFSLTRSPSYPHTLTLSPLLPPPLTPSHYPHPSLVLLFFYSLLATPTLLHWYMVHVCFLSFFLSPLFLTHMHMHIPLLTYTLYKCTYTLYKCVYVHVSLLFHVCVSMRACVRACVRV